ncbi:MAG TPA: phosphate ABC transporter substrate-binding protein PstS [Trebonia sp.]|nr:phosphate ABC transporter substrate-binding protein PstS [Trebonia sp.]
MTALVLAGCSTSASGGGSVAGGGLAASGGAALSGTLNGSGSTFQLTFQDVAISGFKSVQPGITVNYDGVGSGAGRASLAANTANFAGSDSPIPSAEEASFKGRRVLYFPVVTGPVTLSYNLSGVGRLDLTAPVIAGIFDGQINTWDDPAIEAVNPGTSLPPTPITLVVRSDSSGTTANFTKFLVEAADGQWPLGTGSTITWPAGSRAVSGNPSVAQAVKSTPGAIGYVDYATAKASGLAFASVLNKDGNYVAPSPASAALAAGRVTLEPDETFSAVWAGGTNSYPITYQSWDLVYARQPSAKDAKLLRAYLGYLLGAGQELLPQLGYAPLPTSIDQRALAQLSKIGS